MSKHVGPKKPKPIKKPKRLFLAPLLLLAGCASNMISVDAIKGSVEAVSARHDAYVEADDSLSADERSIFLRTTELLRRILEEASK